MYRPLKINNIALDGNLILAPMAGYTDRAMREISIQHGANLAYAEMSSCEALWRGEKNKTIQIMSPYPNEKHLALQIFAGNLEAVEGSMPHVLAFDPAIVDLNIGCPVQKVNKSGAGSALMQNTQELRRILCFIRSAIGKERAMTVKFRSGWNHESLNYLEVGQLALESGADMITLHPRTRAQGYDGGANWSHLKELKATFSQAVVCASGDLHTPEAIKEMFEQTGVDAAMIARGSIGDPFIFQQTRQFLTTGRYDHVEDYQRMQVAQEHFSLMKQYLGDRYTASELKKHLAQYARGNAILAGYRKSFVLAKDVQELQGLFRQVLEELAS